MTGEVVGVLIRKYGAEAVYTHNGGEARTVRAFIQPISYKNRQYLRDTHTPLGRVDTARYMYYGPAEVPLEEDGLGELVSNGKRYQVCRSEIMRFGGADCYVRAVLEPAREVAP